MQGDGASWRGPPSAPEQARLLPPPRAQGLHVRQITPEGNGVEFTPAFISHSSVSGLAGPGAGGWM